MNPLRLDPNAINVISKEGCKYCTYAKGFLTSHGLPYAEEKMVPGAPEYGARRTKLIKITGQATFPWVFVGTQFLGGYHELLHAYNTQRLSVLLKPIGLSVDELDF